MSTIKLMLVDDHAVVRSGIRMLLQAQPDMEIVGEFESGAEAVAEVPALKPHVILMDVEMPDMNGIEATRLVKAVAVGRFEPGGHVLAFDGRGPDGRTLADGIYFARLTVRDGTGRHDETRKLVILR